jgi:WD40 repeat protein
VWDLAYLPSGEAFVSTGADSTLKYCDFKSTRVAAKCNSRIRSISISADGRYIAGGNEGGEVKIWNRNDNFKETTLYTKPGFSIYSVAFSPDGKWLAFGDIKGVVRLIDISDKKIMGSFIGHSATINDISFSKDGKMMASASNDGTVRIWATDTRRLNDPPIILKDHQGWVMSVTFSPDGDEVIAGTSKSNIKVWPTKSKIFAERICDKLKRNFSKAEWERYVAADINFQNTCVEKGGN